MSIMAGAMNPQSFLEQETLKALIDAADATGDVANYELDRLGTLKGPGLDDARRRLESYLVDWDEPGRSHARKEIEDWHDEVLTSHAERIKRAIQEELNIQLPCSNTASKKESYLRAELAARHLRLMPTTPDQYPKTIERIKKALVAYETGKKDSSKGRLNPPGNSGDRFI